MSTPYIPPGTGFHASFEAMRQGGGAQSRDDDAVDGLARTMTASAHDRLDDHGDRLARLEAGSGHGRQDDGGHDDGDQ